MTDSSGNGGDATAGATPDGGDSVDVSSPVDAGESTPPEQSGRSVPKAVAVATGLGVLGAVGLVASIVVLSVLSALIDGFSPGFAVQIAFSQYVGFVGVALGYLWWRGLGRAGIVDYLGIRWPTLREFGLALGGALMMFALAAVMAITVQLIGAEPASNEGSAMAMENPEIIPLMIVVMFLVVGPCEEILYRGIVQNRLRESLSAAPAILIATVVFAAVHVVALSGGGTSGVLLAIGLLIIPGILLGAVYEYTGNLIVPILMHSTYNSILVTLIYIVVVYGPGFEESAGAAAALLPV